VYADISLAPFFIERPRINSLLDKAEAGCLISMKAAFGYGKTQTILWYLTNKNIPAFFFKAKDKHNDPSLFWESFTREVATFDKRAAAKLLAMGFPASDKLFEKYRRVMVASLPTVGKLAVLIDDTQKIGNLEILRFLQRVFDFAIHAGCLCFIIGRRNPGINLSTYRESNSLFEINEAELAFTPYEIRKYLESQGKRLDFDMIRRIYAGTKGWPYAVSQFSKLMGNAGAYSTDLKQRLDMLIFDMMDKQLRENIPPETLKTLLLYSFHRVDLPGYAQEMLLGDKQVIECLTHLDAFVRLDQGLHQFYFQEYFLLYLQDKCLELREDEKKKSCTMALDWCRYNKYTIGILRCYEKLERWDEVYREIEANAQKLSKSELEEVLMLCERSPDWVLYKNPRISFICLWILTQALERFDEAIRYCEKFIAFDCEKQSDPIKLAQAANGYFFKGVLEMFHICQTRQYDFDKWFAKSGELYEKSGVKAFEFKGGYWPGATFCRVCVSEMEDIESFLACVSRVESSCRTLNGYCGGLTNAIRGEIAYYRHDFREAKYANFVAIQQARLYKQPMIEFRVLIYQLMIELHTGNYYTAQMFIDLIEKNNQFPGEGYYLDTFHAVAYANIHQHELVAPWLRDATYHMYGDSDEKNFHYLHYLICFKMLLCDKKYTDLLGYINVSRVVLEKTETLFEKIFIHCLIAICLYKTGKRSESMGLLREAYLLATPGGYDEVFIDFENDMRTLTLFCIKHGGFGIPMEWLKKINSASSGFARRLSLISADFRRATGIDLPVNISSNEKKVLYALYEGYTQSEIASDYNLSQNTVKTIIRTLMIKLNARRQSELVHNAIELALIK
jgi:LuxR family maltose regulon positive regulatory protein